MEFLWFLLIGLAAGWLAGKITKGSGFGVIGDLVVGVVGAMLGGLLFRLVGPRSPPVCSAASSSPRSARSYCCSCCVSSRRRREQRARLRGRPR